jgi:hypothetical protein
MFRSIAFDRVGREQVARFVVWSYRLLALALALYFVVYAWRTRREVEVLKTQVETEKRTQAAIAQSVQDQLDTFYRTLYTDPDVKDLQAEADVAAAKVKAAADVAAKKLLRQPSVVELWQRNRDKELRDRIMRVERWRLDVERRLHEMR